LDEEREAVDLWGEEVGNFVDDLGGEFIQLCDEPVWLGSSEDVDGAFLGGGADGVEDAGKVFDAGNGFGEERLGGFSRGALVGAEFVDGQRGFEALGLPVGFGGTELSEEAVLEFLEEELGVFEFIEELEELAGDFGFVDEAGGGAEVFEDFVLPGNGRAAKDDGVGFLGRDFEVWVALGEFFGVVLPFFPVGRCDDAAGDDGFNAVGSGGAVVTGEEDAEEGEGFVGSELFEVVKFAGFANFDVVGGNGGEALGGVGDLEGVLGVVGEGDDDAVEGGVELFDAAKSPAFVLAERADRQGEEYVDFGNGGVEWGAGIGDVGYGKDGFKARVGLVDLSVCLDDVGAEGLVVGGGLGLEFEGEEPFVELAGGLEVGGEERGKFGGRHGLTRVGEFFDEQEELLGLVRGFFRTVEPKGLCGFPVAVIKKISELLLCFVGQRHV